MTRTPLGKGVQPVVSTSFLLVIDGRIAQAAIAALILYESQHQRVCNEIFHKSAVLETPILLAIEVVSPGSGATDYRYKRTEYAAARTVEYWIVDTFAQKVSVLTLVEGLYEVAEFQREARIVSQTFPELSLTAKSR